MLRVFQIPRCLPLLCVLLLPLLFGCGSRRERASWLPRDTAYLKCEVAGQGPAVSKLAASLPSVTVPSNFYLRNLDPIALHQFGFEPGETVCAGLLGVSEASNEQARTQIGLLHRRRALLSQQAKELGECRCDIAAVAGKRAWLPRCASVPTKRECEPKAEELSRFEELAEDLAKSMEAAHVPRLHWRVVGASDRPDRFVARQSELLGRHSGGSSVFQPGAPVPRVGNYELIGSLLEVEHVLAVVRQDSGRALLVIREPRRGFLVLDLFVYPLLGGAAFPLFAELDNHQSARYRKALAKPEESLDLATDAREGTVYGFHRGALEAVDESLVVASGLAGEASAYRSKLEKHKLPKALVERGTVTVKRHPEQGDSLVARAWLSEDGQGWLAEAKVEGDLANSLRRLGVGGDEPILMVGGKDPGFIARGTPIEKVYLYGLNGLPHLLSALEGAQSGAVAGGVDGWSVEIPLGTLPGDLDTREGLWRLRSVLALSSHRLEGRLLDRGRMLELTLSPK